MRSSTLLPLLAAGLSHALPQAVSSCVTVTSEVIIPTTTATYTTTDVTTIHATTAEDLGTFTLVTTVSSTDTLSTLTSTSTDCTASGTITAGPTTTVYTTSGTAAASTSSASGPAPYYFKRQASACTVTSTFTTTYGETYTFVAATGKTSTFTDYTAFTQATVTSTKYGATAYAIATAVATTSAVCGPTVNATSWATSTVTQDARCAPSALTSAYNGYGLEYASDTPASGAAWATTADDASSCCQLCAEAPDCAASSWDIRTGVCKLEFPVDFDTGALNCGEGLLAYYDAGPDYPMAPGTGLWVAALCGDVEFGQAAPDDGT